MTSYFEPFARLDLALLPEEAAAGLRHLEGLVFFDSSEVRKGAISVIAAMPEKILEGRLAGDLPLLEKCFAAGEEQLPFPRQILAGWVEYEGDFRFGSYSRLLFYSHDEGCWYGKGGLERELRPHPEEPLVQKVQFSQEQSRGEFEEKVRRAQEYIAAGDIYQVNLSQRFTAAWAGETWPLYNKLRTVSPAPYAAFLQLGERAVLSSSPESFLEMRGREIRTRPIKGTRPRSSDASVNSRMVSELTACTKERAELVMITDLERNDLGQVCEFGSVRASELLKLEQFAQVFHLVSTVEGRLRGDVSQPSALRACFPGGSITGAPKKRAMEIIRELEPVKRGLYTGAIGWFGSNGDSRFSIAIRTLISEAGLLHFHSGAGIVADSKPPAEYEETLHKAAGIFLASEGAADFNKSV